MKILQGGMKIYKLCVEQINDSQVCDKVSLISCYISAISTFTRPKNGL